MRGIVVSRDASASDSVTLTVNESSVPGTRGTIRPWSKLRSVVVNPHGARNQGRCHSRYFSGY